MDASPSHRRSRRRIDPVLLGALTLLGAVGMWTMVPLATGAGAPPPVSSDTRIEVEVPVSTSVTPGWKSGDRSVRLPNASIPGVVRDVTSDGWRMTTNWTNGYEVRVRATTSPALRGSGAVDGDGAPASYSDFSTAASCPCPWEPKGAQGVFGYSVSVAATAGGRAIETAKWGTPRERRFRGFTTSSYRAYASAGGRGQFTMSLHLRSEIPSGAVQPQGSYRAGLTVSAHPLL